MALDQQLKLEFKTVEAQLSQRYGSRTLYEALGVSPNATQGQLKKRYWEKMFKYHPDRNTGPDAAQRCKDINVVYGTMSNPEKRAAYDQWLRDKADPPAEQRYSSTSKPLTPSWAQRAYAYAQQTPPKKEVSEKTLEKRLKQFRGGKIPLSQLLEDLSPDQVQYASGIIEDYTKKRMDDVEAELKKSVGKWFERHKKFGDLEAILDAALNRE